MTALSRTWPRFGAALPLAGLFALLFMPSEVWAGKTGTTTWSSSGKTSRTESRNGRGSNYSYSTDADGTAETDAYVYSRDDGHWKSGSGSTRDWSDAEDARDRVNTSGPMLWFRKDGDQYVVTDRSILERLEEAMKPQMELGRQQGELGRRQGELGRLQGELGSKQGRLGRMQANVSRRQALLTARISSASQDDRDTYDLERERDDLSRQQAEISELQSQLGEQQAKLGERQAVLGEQQSKLGEEQSRAAKEMQKRLDVLVREAFDKGLAKRID